VADFSVKKFPAAALREKECAIASKRAARIAPQFRPVSGDAEIGGFFGGSTTLFSRCSLRADLSCFLDVLLASFFAGFSGGTTGVASGKSSANAPRPLGSFSISKRKLLAKP
jgi:hypothetical protein